ncbi:hypothetical protein FRB96_001142 [Tulasnella sp. 330]|nr:hypothetical protein FRB96_001142 [Tulasnella sp. 330]
MVSSTEASQRESPAAKILPVRSSHSPDDRSLDVRAPPAASPDDSIPEVVDTLRAGRLDSLDLDNAGADERDIVHPKQLMPVSYTITHDRRELSIRRAGANDSKKCVGNNTVNHTHSSIYEGSRDRENAKCKLTDILGSASVGSTDSLGSKFPFGKICQTLRSWHISFARPNASHLTAKTTRATQIGTDRVLDEAIHIPRLPSMKSRLIDIYKPNTPSCSGGYGDLYRGVYLPTGLQVALKRPRISPRDPKQAEDGKRRFAREGRNWSKLHHENILPFLGTVVIAGDTCLLSPWLERGDLANFLRMRSWFYELPECERLCHTDRDVFETFDEHWIILGITSGLAYLHTNNVIHGDLKAANILLGSDIQPVLCDFGLTKVIDDELNVTSTGMKE